MKVDNNETLFYLTTFDHKLCLEILYSLPQLTVVTGNNGVIDNYSS